MTGGSDVFFEEDFESFNEVLKNNNFNYGQKNIQEEINEKMDYSYQNNYKKKVK